MLIEYAVIHTHAIKLILLKRVNNDKKNIYLYLEQNKNRRKVYCK